MRHSAKSRSMSAQELDQEARVDEEEAVVGAVEEEGGDETIETGV